MTISKIPLPITEIKMLSCLLFHNLFLLIYYIIDFSSCCDVLIGKCLRMNFFYINCLLKKGVSVEQNKGEKTIEKGF